MRTIVLSLGVGLLIPKVAVAADCCKLPASCDQTACSAEADGSCGCGCCRKTCKVVCEMKKVKRHVWVVQCEEFCPMLPGRGRPGKSCRECGEDTCSCEEDPCAALRFRPVVPPTCMRPRCTKKLVKKEVTCEVPVYKCAVICGGCGACCDEPCAAGREEAPPQAAAPVEALETPPYPETTGEAARTPRAWGSSHVNVLRTGARRSGPRPSAETPNRRQKVLNPKWPPTASLNDWFLPGAFPALRGLLW